LNRLWKIEKQADDRRYINQKIRLPSYKWIATLQRISLKHTISKQAINVHEFSKTRKYSSSSFETIFWRNLRVRCAIFSFTKQSTLKPLEIKEAEIKINVLY
jgi:hypothetical protein